jgi:4-hydroxy-2-oxoheptanedioate aldolase
MARSGLDWIIVDLDHGPIDLGSAHAMITATSGTPCVPLARIAANEPWLAKAPMDISALGINFPMICSPEDAEKAVRSVRYPPRGERLWGTFSRPVSLGRLDAGLYGDRGRRHDLHDHHRACRGG